jgi:hypothetical protein
MYVHHQLPRLHAEHSGELTCYANDLDQPNIWRHTTSEIHPITSIRRVNGRQ